MNHKMIAHDTFTFHRKQKKNVKVIVERFPFFFLNIEFFFPKPPTVFFLNVLCLVKIYTFLVVKKQQHLFILIQKHFEYNIFHSLLRNTYHHNRKHF